MKTEQLQIRMTRAQKASLRLRARLAGLDLTAFVLSRIAPDSGMRFEGIVAALRNARGRRHALADLNDLLVDLDPAGFGEALASARLSGLPDEAQNRVAAMVEHAADRIGVPPPRWTGDIPPLEEPRFATGLRSRRAHLLRASPAAFRRRNLFVDSTVGDRV